MEQENEGTRAMNIVDRIGKRQMENALAQREIPEFAPGDTVRVDVKVVEGSRERIQAFEGINKGAIAVCSPSPSARL